MSRARFIAVMACILLTSLAQIRAAGAVVKAKSAGLIDVSSAIASAHEGDTITVPAGTASWTSTLTITKGITLTGAGNDKTVVLDDIPRTPANRGGAIIIADLSPKRSFRLSGITLRVGSLTTEANNGAVRLKGTCPSVRVDHCHFDRLYQSPCIHTSGWLYGVVDHCVFDCVKNGSSFVIWHDTWGGKSWGEGSWAEPAYWGSEKFIFIEDNSINNLGPAPTGAVIDGKMGGRAVVRYNHFHNSDVNSHGTEYGPQSGVRAYENYNNTFEWTMPNTGGQLRSGTTLIHDNTFSGTRSKGATILTCYRLGYSFSPWGGANGTNSWDLNDTEGNGTNVPGHAPHPYLQGTHTGADNSQTLVVANAGWTKDQWLGYQLTNTSRGPRPNSTFSSTIASNTSDTIIYHWGKTPRPLMTFNNGDHFAVFKCLATLDQPGRGQRNMISRDPRGNPQSPAWPNQALEPVYAWNNKWNGQDIAVVSVSPTVIEGRDFYNDTPKPGYKPYTYPHPLTMGSGQP